MANKELTIIPLYPFKNPLNQISIFNFNKNTSKIEDNLAIIKDKGANIQKENLFLSKEIKTEKVKPSNIKKYNIGTWGIPVIIELIKGEIIARVISESGFKI